MAVIVSMTYQKKLGLPQYSSHSCSLSVQVEVSDLSQVEQESSRLYALLQTSVDAEIQKVGFMPDVAYGIGSNNNGATSGNGAHAINRNNGYRNGSSGHHSPSANGDHWNCTDGQKGMILRIVNENDLDKTEVDKMAQEFFGAGVRQLDKSKASQLIEELLIKTGRNGGRRRWRQPAGARS